MRVVTCLVGLLTPAWGCADLSGLDNGATDGAGSDATAPTGDASNDAHGSTHDQSLPNGPDAGMRDQAVSDTTASADDAGPHFCASVDASFCADFDESALTSGWPIPSTWTLAQVMSGTVMQDPSQALSAPYSLVATGTDFNGQNPPYALLAKSFGIPNRAHVEFDMRASTPPTGNFDSILELQLWDDPQCGELITLDGQNDGLGNVQLQTSEYKCFGGSNQSTPIGSVALGGSWQHIVVDATFVFPDAGASDAAVSSGTLTIRIGSPTSPPIFQGPIQPINSPLHVAVGVDGWGPWTVNFDNVVMDVQ